MSSFEFGTTRAPWWPFDDWERAVTERPAAEDPNREPPRCDKECCRPARPDGGGPL